MMRGGKNGFFSITSVLFQGKNSNWNIHFTITITYKDKTTTDDASNGSKHVSTIITHRTTNFDMFIHRTYSKTMKKGLYILKVQHYSGL
jgi:hypothetical protein